MPQQSFRGKLIFWLASTANVHEVYSRVLIVEQVNIKWHYYYFEQVLTWLE